MYIYGDKYFFRASDHVAGDGIFIGDDAEDETSVSDGIGDEDVVVVLVVDDDDDDDDDARLAAA